MANNLTAIDEKSLWGNQTSPLVLMIPPRVLPANSNITFEAYAKDNINLFEGSARLNLKVATSDPVIMFNRTDGMSGVSQILAIDASKSFDPDNISTLTYLWSCLSGSNSCTNLISNPATSIMTVSPNKMLKNTIYNFTLTLTKKTLNPSDVVTLMITRSIVITAQMAEVPNISIVEIGNIKPQVVNPDNAYRLTAQGTYTSIVWSLAQNLPIIYGSPLNTINLVIAQDSLRRGSTYTLQVLIDNEFAFT